MTTTKIETYKGVDILKDDSDKTRPVLTIQKDMPVIGVLQVGHASIEKAKEYIDKIK